MKKLYLLPVITLLGVIVPISIRLIYVHFLPPSALVQTSYIERPPTDGLIGKFTALTGDVSILKRTATNSAQALMSDTVEQGSSIATSLYGGTTWQLGENTTVEMDAPTDVALIDLVPPTILLELRSGNMTIKTNAPISIRALHMLVEVTEGTSYITNKSGTVSLRVDSGKAKVAYVDRENTTHLWQLSSQTYATINDTTRSIQTTGQSLDKAE